MEALVLAEGEAAPIEGNLNCARSAFALLGNDDFSIGCYIGALLLPPPVQQENDVGIVFYLSCLAEITDVGWLAVHLRGRFAKLAKEHHMCALVLRQLRQRLRHSCHFGALIATIGFNILGIVDAE